MSKYEIDAASVLTFQQKVRQSISDYFGKLIEVIYLDESTLSSIVNAMPWNIDETVGNHVYQIAMLDKKNDKLLMETLLPYVQADEQIHLSANAIYIYCPSGYSHSKLTNKLLEKLTQSIVTIRNYNTLKSLMEK